MLARLVGNPEKSRPTWPMLFFSASPPPPGPMYNVLFFPSRLFSPPLVSSPVLGLCLGGVETLGSVIWFWGLVRSCTL